MYTEKQQSIFKAVLELAGRGENLYTVKVQTIATAAGVGKGTLYEYFQSKEEILVNTMLWCLENELDMLYAALLPGADFEQDLRALQCAMVQGVRKRGGVYQLVLSGLSPAELPGLAETYQEQLCVRAQRAHEIMAGLIAKGRAEGRIGHKCTDEYCEYVLNTALCSMAAPMPQWGRCGKQEIPGEFSLQMVLKALA